MIALFDFFPSYCPQCGNYLGGSLDADYLYHASHSCPCCGTGFQLAETEAMFEAAEKSGGDLGHFHGGEQ